jgi:hypothetical protein
MAIASGLARWRGRLRRRNDGGAFSAPPSEYPVPAPNAPLDPQDCTSNACACPTADVFPPTHPSAIPSPAGSAVAQSRHRSSGTHCEAWSRRSPRRTCIRTNKSAPPSNSAAGPCRNIRSSVEVAAPWSSRNLCLATIVANRTFDSNEEYPSISDAPVRHRCNSFSGNFALSFSRSSTIDERTCATLWCGISTLLTISDRLLRSRSTAFSK